MSSGEALCVHFRGRILSLGKNNDKDNNNIQRPENRNIDNKNKETEEHFID